MSETSMEGLELRPLEAAVAEDIACDAVLQIWIKADPNFMTRVLSSHRLHYEGADDARAVSTKQQLRTQLRSMREEGHPDLKGWYVTHWLNGEVHAWSNSYDNEEFLRMIALRGMSPVMDLIDGYFEMPRWVNVPLNPRYLGDGTARSVAYIS